MTGDAVNYSTDPAKAELQELSCWYANAASVLGLLRDKHSLPETRPSPIRYWPHHSNMEIIFHRNGSENGDDIRVGLVPGDGYYGEPYFHVTPESSPATEELLDIPEIGHWHTKDFVAAILTGSQIVENGMTGEDVAGFLGGVISAEMERPGT